MNVMKFKILVVLLFSIGIFSCTEKETASAKMDEQHRPQYHFTPDSMWMNDPNGMVFFEGEYHLFYQYYPDSTVWGPMHWGHAVSPDMIHWEHLPIALYPDSLGYIFSGSAVIDINNTTGFGRDGKVPMVAIFTHHSMEGEKAGVLDYQNQSIAYSLDKGRSWTKYEGNPVIKNPGIKDFRDPKVLWHEESKKWVMIFAAADRVRLYHSPDLKSWEFSSEFGAEFGGHGGVWECPDLFSMTITETGEQKWVMLVSINPGGPNGGSATQYFVGDFDGKEFKLDSGFAKEVPKGSAKWVDQGKDNYAGVTWSNIPETDGRRLFLGWMSNWQYATVVPTKKWRSAMTLPRTMDLAKDSTGYYLISKPVKEVAPLEGEVTNFSAQKFDRDSVIFQFAEPNLLKVDMEFEIPASGMIALRFLNDEGEYVDVGYAVADQQYFIDRTFAGNSDFSKEFADFHTAEADYKKESVRLLIYLDVASIELFADDGRTVMTDIFFPKKPFNTVSVLASESDVNLKFGTFTKLKPAGSGK